VVLSRPNGSICLVANNSCGSRANDGDGAGGGGVVSLSAAKQRSLPWLSGFVTVLTVELTDPQPRGLATLCGAAIVQEPWGSGDGADRASSWVGCRCGGVDVWPLIVPALCRPPLVLCQRAKSCRSQSQWT